MELCLGLVLSETSSYYAHTHIILPQHLTNQHLFSSHHTTSHLNCSAKLPLHQTQLTRLNCWSHDHWMLGGSFAGVTPLAGLENLLCVTPLAGLENLLCPHIISLDTPALLLSLAQTHSHNQFGDRNPTALFTLIADCLLRNSYSVRLVITQLE
jgi:hypothetical protein